MKFSSGKSILSFVERKKRTISFHFALQNMRNLKRQIDKREHIASRYSHHDFVIDIEMALSINHLRVLCVPHRSQSHTYCIYYIAIQTMFFSIYLAVELFVLRSFSIIYIKWSNYFHERANCLLIARIARAPRITLITIIIAMMVELQFAIFPMQLSDKWEGCCWHAEYTINCCLVVLPYSTATLFFFICRVFLFLFSIYLFFSSFACLFAGCCTLRCLYNFFRCCWNFTFFSLLLNL